MTDGMLLLVEDDPNDLAVGLRALRRAGLSERVAVAHDGAEALSLLAPEAGREPLRPRVVFLDLRMPRMDGWELLQALRALPGGDEIPVVVVSSSGREEDVQRSYALGANGFVVKRFDRASPGSYLVEAARYWLELNRAPESRRVPR
jgi:CheY-like chemotaxis protein